MIEQKTSAAGPLFFRDLHPAISMGTASDRYRGWIGQIYPEGIYNNRITTRTKRVGGKVFQEEVLPVESVADYFQHFSVLEVDYTFYGLLLDKNSMTTRTYQVLRSYLRYLKGEDALILKVPQVIFAQRLWRKGQFVENPDYLNPKIFTEGFYEPARKLLGPHLRGLIFEQEYQSKKDRPGSKSFLEKLADFYGSIPSSDLYHLEIRTESLLTEDYFKMLQDLGLGQVLSHWTWLPPLSVQFAKAGGRFFNRGGQCIIRLMTPLRVRYEDAYEMAHPFDKLVEGMLDPHMITEAATVMKAAIGQGFHANVLSNNRAGGNAPLIAQKVAKRFLQTGIGVE